LAESFRALGEVISAEYERACDSGKGRTTYRELKTAREVEKYYRRGKSTAIDTETVGGVKDPPWCLTFSQDEASGYLIRAENKDAVGRFNLLLNEGPIFNNRKLMNLVYIHNCLFDLDILEDMGVVVMAQLDRLHDTMHGAYHLAKFPKIGLKNLAYRHLGIRMKDFDDVVTPHWVPLALRYVQEVNEFDWGKPPKVWVEDKKKGRYEKQPQSLNTGLKRMISDYAKSYCEDYGILERWFDWWPEMDADTKEGVLCLAGPMPKKSIVNVPFDEALDYACCDSRATWMLGENYLPRERKVLRWKE